MIPCIPETTRGPFFIAQMVYVFCQAQGPPEKNLLNKHTNGPQRQRANLWLTWTMKYWLVDDGILISWRVIIPIIQYIQQVTRVLVTAHMLWFEWHFFRMAKKWPAPPGCPIRSVTIGVIGELVTGSILLYALPSSKKSSRQKIFFVSRLQLIITIRDIRKYVPYGVTGMSCWYLVPISIGWFRPY